MDRRLLIVLGLLALPVLALAGCNALLAAQDERHRQTTRTLHDEARALVPAGARIVAEEESACVELRSAPSCVIVFLDWPGSYDVRRATADRGLRSAGWRPAPGKSRVFGRGDLEAVVVVRRRGFEWAKLCARVTPTALDAMDHGPCLDQIQVRVT